MKKSLFVAFALISCMSSVQAQGFLGKLKQATDKIANATEQMSNTLSKGQQQLENAVSGLSQGQAGDPQAKPKYQLHKTAETKKIMHDGDVEELYPFHDGMAFVKGAKKSFFINNKFEKVFEFQADNLYYSNMSPRFENGRVMVVLEVEGYKKKAAIYDKTGKMIKEWNDVIEATNFENGVAALITSYPEKLFYVDTNGNVIFSKLPLYSGIGRFGVYPLRDGLARVLGKDNKWGYRDDKGNVVIATKYENAHDFHGGLAAVMNEDEKWGFIDKTGKYVIDPIYSIEPGDFHSGLARVKDKEGRLYFIDQTGAFKFKGNADSSQALGEFNDFGFAIWVGAHSFTMDTSFKKVAQFHQLSYSSEDRQAYLQASGADWWQVHPEFSKQSQLFTLNGEVLLNDVLGPFSEGFASFDNEKLGRGYTNMQGEVMATFSDTQF